MNSASQVVSFTSEDHMLPVDWVPVLVIVLGRNAWSFWAAAPGVVLMLSHSCCRCTFQTHTQTQTQTYLFRQDCRKSKVHYLSRLRSCEEGREQDWKLENLGRINKDRKKKTERDWRRNKEKKKCRINVGKKNKKKRKSVSTFILSLPIS